MRNIFLNKKFLYSLFLVDLIILVIHFYNSVLVPDEQYKEFLSLAHDQSIGEIVQYCKWFFIAVVFVLLAAKYKMLHYLSWALLFLYLLFDDALELHEKVGAYLVQDVTDFPTFGLRMQDIGELAVTAIAGGFLSIFLIWAYLTGNTLFKTISKAMLILMFGLSIFGIGVDMLGQLIPPGREIYFIFDVVEDGGEMIIASLMACYIWVTYKEE